MCADPLKRSWGPHAGWKPLSQLRRQPYHWGLQLRIQVSGFRVQGYLTCRVHHSIRGFWVQGAVIVGISGLTNSRLDPTYINLDRMRGIVLSGTVRSEISWYLNMLRILYNERCTRSPLHPQLYVESSHQALHPLVGIFRRRNVSALWL